MKRLFDIIFSATLIILVLPIFLIMVIMVYIKLGKPIFFKQLRAGYQGKPFTIYKFRSMLNLYNSDGTLLPDEKRVSPFCLFLRSSSVDELPQLLNILKGDLSFVGPRPLLLEYNELYSSEQKQRLTVKPGVTGWSQINGRNNLTWDEKFKLDVWYVNNQTFILDIKILLKTFIKVITRDGVNKDGFVTTDKFRGN